MWTNTSLPPSSLATKPNPLASSNHFTFPVTETAVEGSGATRRGPESLTGRPLRPLDDTGRVDFEHAGHLRAFGARADLDAQFRALRDRVVASGMEGVGMRNASLAPPANSTNP